MLSPGDRLRAVQAHSEGSLTVSWWSTTRNGARKLGWPTPFFGWKRAFIKRMLASDENFERALIESGIDVYID